MGLSPRDSTAGEMATQPSANPKNLFAFLLGMLTLTQGLVLPTESLLLRRAAKVQKRNQFPIANGFTGPLQNARCHEEVLLESLTRPARHQTPVSSKRAARSDLDAAISPLLSPVSLPCSLGCGGEVSQPYFILWSTLRAQLFPDTEIVARKRAQRPTWFIESKQQDLGRFLFARPLYALTFS